MIPASQPCSPARRVGRFGLLLLLPLAVSAGAQQVSLAPSQSSFSVTPGGTVSFSLNLDVTGGDQVSGLSYWLTDETTSADDFSITDRDTSTSTFSSLTTSNGTALASPANELISSNQYDLGGGTSDLSAVGTGDYLVANYTLTVAADAAPGTYIISTGDSPEGATDVWAGPEADSFASSAFSQQAVITVTVVPEPATYALVLGLVGVGYACWRRRRLTAAVTRG